ncbi:ribbon-helix-helix domain-containing protein [Clostridium sp. WILCCON 0269]|uniref:Ribbon-helix-helix domain-containing protein n=1 Tax=Candidatus Clostridium eludens TaxID=3381663 RepID=A0ABW8SJD0_9CLOT
MNARNRIRINENIDEKLLDKLQLYSESLDFPKSRIVEEGIRYILKQKISPRKKSANRKAINLTINSELWSKLKAYSELNNYKLVHLLETAIKYSLKKFKPHLTSLSD